MEVIPGAFLFILQLHPITHKQKTNKPIPLRCSTLTHRSVRAGSVSDGCFLALFSEPDAGAVSLHHSRLGRNAGRWLLSPEGVK